MLPNVAAVKLLSSPYVGLTPVTDTLLGTNRRNNIKERF
jgi:hypothetical protein